MWYIKVLHIGGILLFAFGSLLLPACAQVAPQQDTVKELSKDLGELNRLVTQLGASEQQAPEFAPMVHITHDIEGKAQPSPQAANTARFHQGETAQVIERRGDWALVEGQDKKVAWLSGSSAGLQSAAGQAFDAAVEQIIRQLQKMRAKYQQGPVVLSGFSVDVKVPPGASVEFSFK